MPAAAPRPVYRHALLRAKYGNLRASPCASNSLAVKIPDLPRPAGLLPGTKKYTSLILGAVIASLSLRQVPSVFFSTTLT
jgi:hypothetical protein